MEKEEFYISKITADGGPMLKRYRAAAMGRATMIRKRTTHILVELDTKKEISDKAQKKGRWLKPIANKRKKEDTVRQKG